MLLLWCLPHLFHARYFCTLHWMLKLRSHYCYNYICGRLEFDSLEMRSGEPARAVCLLEHLPAHAPRLSLIGDVSPPTISWNSGAFDLDGICFVGDVNRNMRALSISRLLSSESLLRVTIIWMMIYTAWHQGVLESVEDTHESKINSKTSWKTFAIFWRSVLEKPLPLPSETRTFHYTFYKFVLFCCVFVIIGKVQLIQEK